MNWFKKLFMKKVKEEKKEDLIDIVYETDDEVDVDINFSIFFSNGNLSYFIDCEDGKEEQLGVLIGMLTNGKLNSYISGICVDLMGREKAMKIFEANQYYINQLKGNNNEEERPVILPSRAFQDDSETQAMSDM